MGWRSEPVYASPCRVTPSAADGVQSIRRPPWLTPKSSPAFCPLARSEASRSKCLP